MGRRNFLRALVGIGVSTTTVSAFTQAGLADLEFDPETVEESGDALMSGIHQGEVGEIMGKPYDSHATIMESIEDQYNMSV